MSKGAQWNFLKHSELIELEGSKPDSTYYKRLVAKQLIWKKAEKIISNQKIPGYRANIVTYSLATIVHITGNKIDLLGIWNEQDISEKLEECINRIGYEVRDIITNGTGNVTEYCKKEACWNKIKNNIRELPNDFDEILAVGLDAYKQNSEFQPINEEVEYALGINGQTWKHLASWGKHTGILDNREKGICMSIGIKITKDQTPTTKQAHAGKIIYEKAIKNGYNPD